MSDARVKQKGKYLSLRGLTIAGVIAVAGLVWTVEDRYVSKVFAGEVMAAIQQIRSDQANDRLTNELRWKKEQLLTIELQHGVGCSRCEAGSDTLKLFLQIRVRISEIRAEIERNFSR
jgi:GAF domain-containing protein